RYQPGTASEALSGAGADRSPWAPLAVAGGSGRPRPARVRCWPYSAVAPRPEPASVLTRRGRQCSATADPGSLGPPIQSAPAGSLGAAPQRGGRVGDGEHANDPASRPSPLGRSAAGSDRPRTARDPGAPRLVGECAHCAANAQPCAVAQPRTW